MGKEKRSMGVKKHADARQLAPRSPLFSSLWESVERKSEADYWVSFPELPLYPWLGVCSKTERMIFDHISRRLVVVETIPYPTWIDFTNQEAVSTGRFLIFLRDF
jgi:hypothetical protein